MEPFTRSSSYSSLSLDASSPSIEKSAVREPELSPAKLAETARGALSFVTEGYFGSSGPAKTKAIAAAKREDAAFAGGRYCINHKVLHAVRAVLAAGEDIDTIVLIFDNACRHNYAAELAAMIAGCGGEFLIGTENAGKRAALIKGLAERGIDCTIKETGEFEMRTAKPERGDEDYAKAIDDALGFLAFMPTVVTTEIIQQHGQKPLSAIHSLEGRRQFTDIFSTAGNHAYKRRLFEQAIQTNKLDYLNELFKEISGGAREVDLSGVDLSGLNLTLKNQSSGKGLHLQGANLSNTNLSGTTLDYAVFTEANLSKVNLAGAVLNGAKFNNANLCDADLSQAILDNASLDGANLSGTKLQGAKIRAVNLNRVTLTGGLLTGADLMSSSLQGTTLTGNFNDVAMPENCDGATLIDADLRKVRFGGDYNGGSPGTISFKRAVLTNVRLPQEAASGRSLKLDFTNAELSHIDMRSLRDKVVLEGATLFKVNLADRDLSDTSMQGATLKAVDLTGAKLIRVNLRGATLIDTNIRAAASLDDMQINGRTAADFSTRAYLRYLALKGQIVRD